MWLPPALTMPRLIEHSARIRTGTIHAVCCFYQDLALTTRRLACACSTHPMMTLEHHAEGSGVSNTRDFCMGTETRNLILVLSARRRSDHPTHPMSASRPSTNVAVISRHLTTRGVLAWISVRRDSAGPLLNSISRSQKAQKPLLIRNFGPFFRQNTAANKQDSKVVAGDRNVGIGP